MNDLRRWVAGELLAGVVCAGVVSLTRWLLERYQRTHGTWEMECAECGATYTCIGYNNVDVAGKLHAEFHCPGYHEC